MTKIPNTDIIVPWTSETPPDGWRALGAEDIVQTGDLYVSRLEGVFANVRVGSAVGASSWRQLAQGWTGWLRPDPNEGRMPRGIDSGPLTCCRAEHDGYYCTRWPCHSGAHVAHGAIGGRLKRWTTTDVTPPKPASVDDGWRMVGDDEEIDFEHDEARMHHGLPWTRYGVGVKHDANSATPQQRRLRSGQPEHQWRTKRPLPATALTPKQAVARLGTHPNCAEPPPGWRWAVEGDIRVPGDIWADGTSSYVYTEELLATDSYYDRRGTPVLAGDLSTNPNRKPGNGYLKPLASKPPEPAIVTQRSIRSTPPSRGLFMPRDPYVAHQNELAALGKEPARRGTTLSGVPSTPLKPPKGTPPQVYGPALYSADAEDEL